MYSKFFDDFKIQLKAVAPELIKEILSHKEKVYGIAFLTTDDFYGMYVAFQTEEALGEKKEYRWFPNEWKYSDTDLMNNYSKELYDNLVSIVESVELNYTVNLLEASPNKLSFALSFVDALGEVINALPESLFKEYSYSKEDILFLTTMSDGDYMGEMMIESAKKYNTLRTASEVLNLYNKHLTD